MRVKFESGLDANILENSNDKMTMKNLAVIQVQNKETLKAVTVPSEKKRLLLRKKRKHGKK